jgi:hypothetical protein
MDLYTAERLFVERLRELQAAGDREQLVRASRAGDTIHVRAWIASRLRSAADRIDGRVMERAV